MQRVLDNESHVVYILQRFLDEESHVAYVLQCFLDKESHVVYILQRFSDTGSLFTWRGFGKCQMGSALMGSLQMLCFLKGLFGYSR